MLLSNLKHPEVTAYLNEKKTVIIPCGSLEQHGPPWPLPTKARPFLRRLWPVQL